MTAKNVARRRPGPKSAISDARDAALAPLGGVDALYDFVAAGMTFGEICKELGLPNDAQHQQSLRKLARRDPQRYDEAKQQSVERLQEKAGEVYGETAPVTSADAKWRNDRSNYYRWLAEWRGGILEKSAVAVNVDIGQLHLEALRAAGSRTTTEQRRAIPNAAATFISAQDAAVTDAD